MNILLDTHAFLWFINGDPQLSTRVRALIEDIANDRLLSMASVWEMGIKASTGKLQMPAPFTTFLTKQLHDNRIDLLPISISHVEAIIALPYHHRDPFDRIIIAQAITERLPLVSVDSAFDTYGITRLW
jgi:PIN domain nuclease of toxin-antitoxin system